jgi:hypothetical protein
MFIYYAREGSAHISNVAVVKLLSVGSICQSGSALELNYSVIWTQEAESGLAAAWLAATDRDAVTAASHRLEDALKSNPRLIGESRASSMVRIAIAHPVGIEFEVIEDDKKVRVLEAWLIS